MNITVPDFDVEPRCAGLAPEEADRLFFGNYPAEGVRFCQSCPVIDSCRQWATDHRVFDGVWGGESPVHRRERIGMKYPEVTWDPAPRQYNRHPEPEPVIVGFDDLDFPDVFDPDAEAA